MSVNSIDGGRTIPAEKSETIDSQKSDTVDITFDCRGVHISTAGTIAGYLKKDATTGSARSFTVVAGREYPYAFKRIKATGTTVTGVVLG